MKYALVDATGLAYRLGFACEKTVYLVEDLQGAVEKFSEGRLANTSASLNGGFVWSRAVVEDTVSCLGLVEAKLKEFETRFKDYDKIIFFFDGVGNFRTSLATRAVYKGNRDTARRPVHFNSIKNYILDCEYTAHVSKDEEADDLLGIWATSNPGSVIVSFDKDLNQVPGDHYNWVKDEFYRVGQKEAQINLYSQVLSGDATDNIPGLPGIGPAKARKILSNCNSVLDCWKAVRASYETQGFTIDDAIETARLVYVRRKAGEFWNPPTVY